MKLKIKEINKETSDEIIKLVSQRLPKNGKILVLSLTGSQAFGWGAENFDLDIHGLVAVKNWWDYAHLGKERFDINIFEFSYILQHLYYQSFEFFQNISNPFFIHPKFNYNRMMKFCTVEAVKYKKQDILRQINEFEFLKNPRAALHAYRLLMVPLYFLKRKKIELNVFKINRIYKFKQLEKLKIAYTQGGEKLWDEKEVMKDLNRLLKEYDRLCQKKEEKVDKEAIDKWFEKTKKEFYKT